MKTGAHRGTAFLSQSLVVYHAEEFQASGLVCQREDSLCSANSQEFSAEHAAAVLQKKIASVKIQRSLLCRGSLWILSNASYSKIYR